MGQEFGAASFPIIVSDTRRRRQGGQVRGEGTVGQGAAFFFTLPEVAVVSDLTTW